MSSVPADAETILRRYRHVAVVGVSVRPERPSHYVSRYLLDAGYDVHPVNPLLSHVLGRPCHPSLRTVPPPIEVACVFRRSELVAPVVDDAIAVGAKAVWMQEGVVDATAAAKARAAGLLVVMDRCMLRDHQALGLAPNSPGNPPADF